MAATITYWGYSAFKVVTEAGTTVLIDPLLSANPDAPVRVDDVDRADLILVTHVHRDHLGDAFELTKRTGATLLGGPETQTYAKWRGVAKEQALRISPGGRRVFGDVTVQAVQACHNSFVETEDGGFVSGQPLSFIVILPSGERLFHSGDTALFSDLKLFRELYQPNVAAFSIGTVPGGAPHITPYEAALACQWLGIETVIPMHYFDPAEAEEFRGHLARLAPEISVVVLKPGEACTQLFRQPAGRRLP